MISIKEVMDKEHKRILDIFSEFSYAKEDSVKRELFSKFKWNIQKHFFLEEKAIFSVYGSISGQEVSDIFDLMQEHGTIIEIIKGIEQAMENGKEIKTSLLTEKLEQHSDFEDNVFYPKLDKELSEEQKKEIAERANEILE